MDDDRWLRVERARGTLPPGVLEGTYVAKLSSEIDDMLEAAAGRGIGPGTPATVDVDVALPDGTRVVGAVALGLGGPARGPGRIQFTRPKESYRLEAWLDLMVLTARDPGTDWHSVVVTRAKDASSTIRPVELVAAQAPDRRAMALDALTRIVGLYRAGRRQPLPLFASHSPAVHAGGSSDDTWQDSRGLGDGTRPAVRLVFGDVDVDELGQLEPLDGDPPGPGGRVERFARHLWGTVAATSEQVP